GAGSTGGQAGRSGQKRLSGGRHPRGGAGSQAARQHRRRGGRGDPGGDYSKEGWRQAMINVIGLVEFTSIAQGIDGCDIMLKTANVELLVAKTVCPGKYIVLVAGDTSAVQQSVGAGVELGAET